MDGPDTTSHVVWQEFLGRLCFVRSFREWYSKLESHSSMQLGRCGTTCHSDECNSKGLFLFIFARLFNDDIINRTSININFYL